MATVIVTVLCSSERGMVNKVRIYSDQEEED